MLVFALPSTCHIHMASVCLVWSVSVSVRSSVSFELCLMMMTIRQMVCVECVFDLRRLGVTIRQINNKSLSS